MADQGHQPRVVVQLANGQEVPTSPGGGQYLQSDEDHMDAVAQLASMGNVDFEESGMDDLAMSSPPPCGDPSAQHLIMSPTGQLGEDDVDVTGDQRQAAPSGAHGRRPAASSGGRGATVHPPTSPSPPPSMTPPDHYGGHVVHHQKAPRRAQVVTTPGGTAVQQQQPPTPGMVPDHCYGLPYQDHNYGGATAGAGGAAAAGNGSTTSSSTVRLSSGSQPAVRPAGMRTSRSSMSEENQEPFPIIGGLASYLGEDDSDDQGGLGPTATSTPLLSGSGRTLGGRSVGGDSLGITAYHRGGSVRDQGPGVPYYQRYVSSHHADSATFGHQYASPSYSQSLVTIGGRTYIRQVAAPTSTVGGYRSAGRDYLGISSPNQSIYNISGSPYGATRRVVPGGVTGVTTFKRAGRPRTRGGVQTHTTLVPALPHGSMLGDGSPAPIIAPSRGGRPSGRGRARADVSSSDSGGGQTGARRARGAAAGGTPTPTSPQMTLTQRRETKNAAAVLAEENRKAQEAEELNAERLANPATTKELVNEVQKKYQKLLESPLPSAKTAKQRKSAKGASLSPSKQMIDVENDRPDRTPSPITSVIMAARADAERRKSRDAADMVVESVVRSPIRGPPLSQPTSSRKRQASPDFSLFEDPCVKEERDRDRAQAEAAAREQARKLMASSPLVGIPTSPGPVVRSPVGHSHLQDVYPRPVDYIKVDDSSATQSAEDAADDTSDASSTSDEEETAESWESSSSGSDADKHWAGDYVTRCLCGMQHNDEFMISCDQCDVWQHCRCMGIDTKRVPDNYLCEKCKPRPLKLTPAQAKEFQGKKLAKWAKDKERRKQQRAKRHEQRSKDRQKRKLMRKSAKKQGAMMGKQTTDEYSEIAENEYTSDGKRFVEMQGDSSGQVMLEQLSEQLCQVMYVAPGVQGLVSAHLVPPNQPVAEYRGRVCLKAECNGRDKAGRIQPHCLLYSGFTTGSSSTDAVLCIDARQKGSAARFARRSCRPNTQVKHVIRDERLHLLLISTELIERGTEVTVPFDYDFRSSKFPLECACGATTEKEGDNEEDDVCPIKELNRNLKVKKAQIVRNRTQVRKDKQKQVADSRAADQSRRAKEAQLRKAANKNSTAVKRAAQKVKAKLAVKSRKVQNKKQQAAAAAAGGKRRLGGLKLKSKRLSSRTASTGSVKEEKPSVAEGKGKAVQKQQPPAPSPPPAKRTPTTVKRTIPRARTRSSATDSGSDAISPRPSVPPKKEEPLEPMDYTLPEDRNKPVSREERKLQMAVAQITKLEENAKRKAENKQRRLSGERTATPPSASSKKVVSSPLRRGRVMKKPTVVHRKKTTNKWKRGQASKIKAGLKAKRKPGAQASSPAKRGSKDDLEVISSDEEGELTSEDEDEEEEKSGRSGRGQVAAIDSSASRGPPRKRWGSSTVQSPASPPSIGVSTRSGGSPAVSGVSTLSPAGGGKKRWLRQAMSEESVGDEPVSPPKKRRPGFDGPIIIPTEPVYRSGIDPMTPVEAAQLLTQMATDPQTPASPPPGGGQQFGSPTRLIPTVAVDFGIVAPTVIPPASGDRAALLSSGSHDGSEPQPARRERRKVTLDEYKKRKGPPRDAKKGGDEGPKQLDTDWTDAPGSSSSRTTTSFIPTLSEAELLESGRSHRLSSLPDPNQIGKTTVSVDDLKRRIYGKQFTAAHPVVGSPTTSTSSQDTAQSEQQHALPPPPPPPPKKTEEQQRMSLADRLRTEFGLDDPSTDAALPPPPPPPPPGVGDPPAGWGNGPAQPSAAGYQTRSSRRW